VLIKRFLLLAFWGALSGCATIRTLDANFPLPERIFIYSGTRLDSAALCGNTPALKRMKIAPPDYPGLDLPFSFALDSLLLPMTVYAELFH
jgi:uncharacterized protein YceK